MFEPPKPDVRPDGYRCLAFHRGRWRDVMWVEKHKSWMFGYASAMIRDSGRQFSPLPELPKDAGEFWDGESS